MGQHIRRKEIMKILRVALYSLLLLLVGSAGFISSALLLGDFSPNMIIELVLGETPQAKITAYLQAIQVQDRAAALDAWMLPAASTESFAELNERRNLVTDELLARQITGFTIFEPEWWSTCCDPGVIHHVRNAGGARVQVQVLDAQGQPWLYTFDVFVNGPYFGDAAGNPYRRWLLRDVYPLGEPPAFWTLLYTGELHYPQSSEKSTP
jgi:hypothetical protein